MRLFPLRPGEVLHATGDVARFATFVVNLDLMISANSGMDSAGKPEYSIAMASDGYVIYLTREGFERVLAYLNSN